MKKEKYKEKIEFKTIMDSANVMAICQIYIKDDGEIKVNIPFLKNLRFNKTKNISILTNQKIKNKLFIYYKKRHHVTITKELFDNARKVIKAFYYGATDFKIACAEKDEPILMYYDSLGIMIAPRVDDLTIYGEYSRK